MEDIRKYCWYNVNYKCYTVYFLLFAHWSVWWNLIVTVGASEGAEVEFWPYFISYLWLSTDCINGLNFLHIKGLFSVCAHCRTLDKFVLQFILLCLLFVFRHFYFVSPILLLKMWPRSKLWTQQKMISRKPSAFSHIRNWSVQTGMYYCITFLSFPSLTSSSFLLNMVSVGDWRPELKWSICTQFR